MNTLAALLTTALAAAVSLTASDALAGEQETIQVSGSGVDFASDAIVHSEENTPNGVIRRLTEIVKLSGDLSGYVLYQPTQKFDHVNNTLLVTGTNFFSGTIAESDPVNLRSDESSFEMDLATGEETGHVHLTRSNDAPDKGQWFDCDLVVVGTGATPEGNPTFDYSGTCTRRGR